MLAHLKAIESVPLSIRIMYIYEIKIRCDNYITTTYLYALIV